MADVFSLDIRDLHRYLDTGTVYSVEWTLKGERTIGNSIILDAITKVTTGLGPADPNVFIPYADLTQAEVGSWIESVVGKDQLEEMKLVLTNKLDELENPTKGRGVPWPTKEKPADHPEATWNEANNAWEYPVDTSGDEGTAWHPTDENPTP